MAETITVLMDRCTMQINLEPFFSTCTLSKANKLFGYIFQEPWRNEDTIAKLKYYLYSMVENAKEVWHSASVKYQNEYKNTQFEPFITDQQKKKHIEANNKKLLNNVQKAKRLYERAVKIQAKYTALADKYNT